MNIRPITPVKVEGQSSGFLRTQGSEICWPQVAVMRKGTGAFAQRQCGRETR